MLNEEAVRILRTIGVSRPGAAPFSIDLRALPHAALSYSMAGEDLALRKIFKRQIMSGTPGLFVDIGCSAPVSLSNTYAFYCLGWRGLCVDANPDAAPYWGEARPGDKFVHAAVSACDAPLHFFRHMQNEGMHKISTSPGLPAADFRPSTETIPAARLADLFATHLSDRAIDLMSMDIEGSELEALQSNDWNRWRPKVIIVECTNFDFAHPIRAASIALLIEQSYRIHSKVSENVILIDQR